MQGTFLFFLVFVQFEPRIWVDYYFLAERSGLFRSLDQGRSLGAPLSEPDYLLIYSMAFHSKPWVLLRGKESFIYWWAKNEN